MPCLRRFRVSANVALTARGHCGSRGQVQVRPPCSSPCPPRPRRSAAPCSTRTLGGPRWPAAAAAAPPSAARRSSSPSRRPWSGLGARGPTQRESAGHGERRGAPVLTARGGVAVPGRAVRLRLPRRAGSADRGAGRAPRPPADVPAQPMDTLVTRGSDAPLPPGARGTVSRKEQSWDGMAALWRLRPGV